MRLLLDSPLPGRGWWEGPAVDTVAAALARLPIRRAGVMIRRYGWSGEARKWEEVRWWPSAGAAG